MKLWDAYYDIKIRHMCYQLLSMSQTSNFIQDLFFNTNLSPLVKPDISFGNYFLEWDEKSLGLYSNETFKFKTFIKNIIPGLGPIMKIINISRTKNNNPSIKVISDKGQFSIAHKCNNRIVFVLNIDADGVTGLFREERIFIDGGLFEKLKHQYESKDSVLLDKLKDINNVVSVKWKIGNLMFNRLEHGK